MERRAASVRYDQDRDAIEIELTDGAAVRLPRAMVEEIRDVPPTDMAAVRVSPAGYGIKLDRHDMKHQRAWADRVAGDGRRHGRIAGEAGRSGAIGSEVCQRAGKWRQGCRPRKVKAA